MTPEEQYLAERQRQRDAAFMDEVLRLNEALQQGATAYCQWARLYNGKKTFFKRIELELECNYRKDNEHNDLFTGLRQILLQHAIFEARHESHHGWQSRHSHQR